MKNIITQLRRCKDNLLSIDEHIAKDVSLQLYQQSIITSNELGVLTDATDGIPIVVSLTSYGVRLQKVSITIESLMRQTVKPHKIVLSISENIDDNELPVSLKLQAKRGLEINRCKDVRSYTKLLPALRKYPDAAIITVDDDMIYPFDFIEYLVKAFVAEPKQIHFYYGHSIGVKNGELTSYNEWVKETAEGASVFNLPTGVDGILYPPNSLDNEVFNEDVFLKICPSADDIWFKAMSLKKGTLCHRVQRALNPRAEFIAMDSSNITSLASVNRVQELNDIQAKNVFSRYNLLEKLK